MHIFRATRGKGSRTEKIISSQTLFHCGLDDGYTNKPCDYTVLIGSNYNCVTKGKPRENSSI